VSVTAAAAPQRTWVGWLGLVLRIVLGAVFVYAGSLKVTHPKEAGLAVQAYRLFPPELARTIGYALPTIEICLGLLLIVGLFTRVAAALTGVLLVAFIIGVISVWVRGYNIDCGCFGGGGDVTGAGRNARYAKEVVRDGVLALVAAWLVYRPRTALSLDGWLSPHLHHRHHHTDTPDADAELDHDGEDD
jgi:uncharacterized membrane protein YphA (DoxX/SURF4 family)